MSRGAPTPIRATIGVIALLSLLLVVNSWISDYRGSAEGPQTSGEATATPDGDEAAAEGEPEEPGEPETESAGQGTVVVIIEGLNFRREPARDGELIRGLRLNDELTHLGTVDGWYHVRDGDGVEGYVSTNSQYTELRE